MIDRSDQKLVDRSKNYLPWKKQRYTLRVNMRKILNVKWGLKKVKRYMLFYM